MANVLNLLNEFTAAPSPSEGAPSVDFNRLKAHEINAIFAPTAASRYSVCEFGANDALRSIGVSHPDIPAVSAAEFADAGSTNANHDGQPPALEVVRDDYQSAQVESNDTVRNIAADNFMAVGGLAHAAYEGSSVDAVNAKLVQTAWNNYGQAGPRNVIDPAEIPTTPIQPEAASLAEQKQYLSRIADASEPIPGGQQVAAEGMVDHDQASQVQAATNAVNEFWATQAQTPRPFYPSREQPQQPQPARQYPQPVPLPIQPAAAAQRPYDPYQEYAARRAA